MKRTILLLILPLVLSVPVLADIAMPPGYASHQGDYGIARIGAKFQGLPNGDIVVLVYREAWPYNGATEIHFESGQPGDVAARRVFGNFEDLRPLTYLGKTEERTVGSKIWQIDAYLWPSHLPKDGLGPFCVHAYTRADVVSPVDGTIEHLPAWGDFYPNPATKNLRFDSYVTPRVLALDTENAVNPIVPLHLSDRWPYGTTTAAIDIYSLETGEQVVQKLQSPVGAVKPINGTPPPDDWSGSYTWDGTVEGGTAPKGLYTYNVTVSHTEDGWAWDNATGNWPFWIGKEYGTGWRTIVNGSTSGFDADQRITSSASITPTSVTLITDPSPAPEPGLTPLLFTYNVSINSLNPEAYLTDTGVKVYDPDLNEVAGRNVGPAPPGDHSVRVDVDLSQPGDYYYVIDAMCEGKPALEKGGKLDRTPPGAFTLSANPAGWTNANVVQVSFSATDAGSGIDHYELAVDEGTYSTQVSPYDLDVSGLTDGIHTVHVKAIDKCNNEQIGDLTIYLDKTDPEDFTPTADPATWTNADSTSIIFSATDTTSGINRYEVAVDGGTYSPAVSSYDLDITGLSDGPHTVHVRAIDNAGNERVKDVTVYTDKAAPADFMPIADPAAWTNASSIQISFFTTDPLSGINHYEVAVDAGSYTTQENPYTLSTSGLSDGIHTVHVKAIDNAGNQKTSDVLVYIDKSLPADFTLTADPASGPSNWSKTDVIVSFSTTDATSGMDHFEVSTDGTNYSTTGVVWPGIDFDDQLDSDNKGTLSSVDYADGYWGDAASFGIASQYVRYAAANFPAQGTIGFWIKGAYDAGRGNNTVLDTVGTSTATNGDLRLMLISGNRLRLQIYSGGWQSIDSTSSLSAANWTYVAVSYGSSGLKMFIDGSQQGSTGPTASRTTTDVVSVGDYQENPNTSLNAFNGAIDCIRVSHIQSDASITAIPTLYMMSYKMATEEHQTVSVKAIDRGGNERVKTTDTYIDKTKPTFTVSQVNPTPAKNNGSPVSIVFTSEDLPTNPAVTVNGHSASYSSKSASDNSATYTYTYYVQPSDPDGDATIAFSGTDRAGNSNTVSNTTALDIWALQWSTPLADATSTVKLAWNYTHTFYKQDIEYSTDGGSTWIKHNLFDVTQANQSDYRLWSMGSGTRKFRVRVYENQSNSFIAGVTNDVTVPGGATLPNYPYVDYLSADQRGRAYVPAY